MDSPTSCNLSAIHWRAVTPAGTLQALVRRTRRDSPVIAIPFFSSCGCPGSRRIHRQSPFWFTRRPWSCSECHSAHRARDSIHRLSNEPSPSTPVRSTREPRRRQPSTGFARGALTGMPTSSTPRRVHPIFRAICRRPSGSRHCPSPCVLRRRRLSDSWWPCRRACRASPYCARCRWSSSWRRPRSLASTGRAYRRFLRPPGRFLRRESDSSHRRWRLAPNWRRAGARLRRTSRTIAWVGWTSTRIRLARR